MTPYEKLVSFMHRYIPVERWYDFLMALEALSMEAKREILEYARNYRD